MIPLPRRLVGRFAGRLLRLLVACACAFLLVACQVASHPDALRPAAGFAGPAALQAVEVPVNDPPAVAPEVGLAGRVSFAGWLARRQTQVAMADVAAAATISLINTATSVTVASTVTASDGTFLLVFPAGFAPSPTAVYTLEAFKGLASNLPGNSAARVRTLVRWNGGWTSLANSAPGAVYLDPGTTALSIGAALLGAAGPFAFSSLIGVLALGTPDVYTPPSGTTLTSAHYDTILSLVRSSLAADLDPVAQISYNAGADLFLRNGSGLAVTSLSASTGAVGSSLTITGLGFDPDAANDRVSFGGVNGTITNASATQLVVTVPAGARTAPVVVTVDGVSVVGPTFGIVPVLTALSVATGSVGGALIVTGSNFSPIAAENDVSIGGVNAPLQAASSVSLQVLVPQVPAGAASVSVSVLGQAVAYTGNFTVQPTVTGLSVTSGASGDTVVIAGNAFNPTAASNSVTITGAPCSVTGATATTLTAKLPGAPATSSPLVVAVGGQTASSAAFTLLPKITSLSVSTGGAGTAVTVTGSGFHTTVSRNAVAFNGAGATLSGSTATTLSLTVPAGAISGELAISTDGLIAASRPAFTVPVTFTSFSPAQGAAGTSVTIGGTGFAATAGGNAVTFGTATASVVTASATQLVVTVPFGVTTGQIGIAVGPSSVTSTASFVVTALGGGVLDQ